MIDTKRPIRRSRDQRMLGGVLGGLAEWLGWDPSVARVAYILITVFTGFALGVVAYAVLWLFVPLEEPGPLANRANGTAERPV
jgi:phage shock protein C